jgi:hypothetical protein
MSRNFLALIALVVLLALTVHFVRAHRAQVAHEESLAAEAASVARAQAVQIVPSETQILASCHPHLGPNVPSVPNMDVSRLAHPAMVRVKVRMWVNGDGFVTRAFLGSTTRYGVEDLEADLQFVKGLTFAVPDSPECHARQVEVIGNFVESLTAAGDWETVLEVHPRYSLDGTRVVVEP